VSALAGMLADAPGASDMDAQEVLAEVNRRAMESHTPDQGGVTLSTLHKAKGLEWDAVFLVALTEGSLPSAYAKTAEQLSEERRLFYVGITRARRHLNLSHAWTRTIFGRTQQNIPSRFLGEVPSELVKDVGLVTTRQSRNLSTESRRYTDRESYSDRRGNSSFVPERAFSARRPGPRSSTGAEDLGLAPGDAVVHDHWGPGTVVTAKGEGARAQATVEFESVGKKTLLLSATPLRRA
jgi:DNA helicase II / ATP-dependent DNA helicase PcrA